MKFKIGLTRDSKVGAKDHGTFKTSWKKWCLSSSQWSNKNEDKAQTSLLEATTWINLVKVSEI